MEHNIIAYMNIPFRCVIKRILIIIILTIRLYTFYYKSLTYDFQSIYNKFLQQNAHGTYSLLKKLLIHHNEGILA